MKITLHRYTVNTAFIPFIAAVCSKPKVAPCIPGTLHNTNPQPAGFADTESFAIYCHHIFPAFNAAYKPVIKIDKPVIFITQHAFDKTKLSIPSI